MNDFIRDAGIFAWPLFLCLALATFIVVERMVALRQSRIIPKHLQDLIISGTVPTDVDTQSVAGRILLFFQDPQIDADQLKAYARLQLSKMERGFFVLEVIVGAAPLLGLLGTVTGLVEVFANLSPDTGMPEMGAFREGVALALTTTMMGLTIAIPALAFNSYLNRRVDNYAAQLEVAVERLANLKRTKSALK
jgi:biopolymer transport protein ExbB|tara:strand:- start:748 stop:1326 length:579 start_codon:yes stop_codon:yes gene_type:complete